VPIEQSPDYTGQVIDASQEGPACYQGITANLGSTTPSTIPQSEDCLLLDVLVPMNPVSPSLPVLVQIHGGGYIIGSPTTIAPGDAMVNASNGNIIYVQIQYRLGMFGFLGGSQVAQDGARNAGLLDQRAALLWVQRNIRPFGGDPAKVSIIGMLPVFTTLRTSGGSAGGGSVTYQLIAGGAYDQPPFRGAIAEYPW
jgi:carboxylesterase type B